jgi:general stress protein 26
MPDLKISPQVEEFLSRRLLGRLATSSFDGQPHVVPVWFLWEDGAIWISSYKSTRKVFDIESNPKCALVVDIENAEGGLTAVMLEGISELIKLPSDEFKQRIFRIYTKYLGPDGVNDNDPQTWLNSPENLLIKLTLSKIKSW